MADREYDIVVFGATGFTGALTAEYLARHAPATTRWALAGRNREKLEAVRRRLAQTSPATGQLPRSCAFGAIPYDLGGLFAVQHLPEGVPIELEGFVRVNGTFSGGTYHSAVHIMGRLRQGMKVASERKQREPRPEGRRVRGV